MWYLALLWCISIMSGACCDNFPPQILLNKEMIAVNQDKNGEVVGIGTHL